MRVNVRLGNVPAGMKGHIQNVSCLHGTRYTGSLKQSIVLVVLILMIMRTL